MALPSGIPVRVRRPSPLVRAGVALGIAAGAAAAFTVKNRARLRAADASFEGQVVVVTGGSRGLGLALARRFAEDGAHLILIARDIDGLRAALPLVRHCGAASVTAIPCDVRDPAQVSAAVEQTIGAHGRIDVLVNNAGIIRLGPVEHTEIEDFEDSLNTHLWGPLHFVRATLPHFLRHGGGRIINIASVGGRVSVPHLLPYSVGKFALVGLSEGLHTELHKHNIAVTTVTPFVMRTGSHRNVEIRGQHTKEAILFALSASTPATSVNADRAADQIVEASRLRRARVSPGWQARAAELFNVLAPEQLADLFAWANQFLLPGPSDKPDAGQLKRSRDIDTKLAARVFPTTAAYQFNQIVAADEELRH